MREQINGRFTPGTRARIQRLARPGEAIADTLERALDALEASPAAEPLELRVERLERLLSASSAQRPATDSNPLATDSDAMVPRGTSARGTRPHDARTRYPDEAKRFALDMLAAGSTHRQIADALGERFGLKPSTKNLPRHFARWRDELRDSDAGEGDAKN